MTKSKINPLTNDRFPLSSNYDYQWLIKNCFASNPLWLTEWLCNDIKFESGMRVLDLGCGHAKSSIFLAKEFDVKVWAIDLWVDANDNYNSVKEFGLEDKVIPLSADIRSISFPFEYFDAILAFDAIQYFGTDILFLPNIIQYLKPNGLIGFASPGMTKELSGEIPKHLQSMWTTDFWSIRSEKWWFEHWSRTGLVDIDSSETMEDGWKYWAKWARVGNSTDWFQNAIKEDAGRHLGYIKMLAKKNKNAPNLAYNLQTGEWI